MLEGKNAIVTGGTRGLGASISEELARQGARVCVTYRQNNNAAEEHLANLKKLKADCFALKIDVCNFKQVQFLTDEVTRRFGELDILINNAGINHREFFDETTHEVWDEILDTNLKAQFFITQALWPLLKAADTSRVVNISSVAGQYHGPKTVHYAVSKAGLNSLTKALARYGAPDNIYVNALAPGIILTDQTGEEFESGDAMRIIEETTLLKRPGTLSDVQSAIRFLCDPQQNYMTAQVIALSGGAIMTT